MVWPGLIWLRNSPVAGSCEHGNETSSSLKHRYVLNCWETTN